MYKLDVLLSVIKFVGVKDILWQLLHLHLLMSLSKIVYVRTVLFSVFNKFNSLF